LSACFIGCLWACDAARAGNVVVPGSTDFPESMTTTADGTLFFSSMAGGRIFRAAPGAAQATEWIKQGTNGLASALGVLADENSNTLYVCSVDLSGGGVIIPTGATPGALKLFDLKTGAAKGSALLPPSTLLTQTALCNDIAVAADGTVYVTDSLSGHILRMKPGSEDLEIWAHDARWDVAGPQLDGIAVLPDGSAGAVTKLQTSRPLYHSDGLRAYGPDRLLMVEGETKGTLDMIAVSGDAAKIDTIKGGFEGPVSLAQVGDTVYVLDVPLKYLFDPNMKSQTPPPFAAFGVKVAW
jgi:sugar lactone lactonase YvrE